MIPSEYICPRPVSFIIGEGSEWHAHIDLGAVDAVGCRSHFRCRVISCADAPCHAVRLESTSDDGLVHRELAARRQAKVSYLDVIHTIDAAADDVFWLQIAVNDARPVDVGQALEELPEEPPDLDCVLAEMT